MSNKSKYHKIIIDEDKQSGISNARYNLTVEEFYDLMHHTHNAEDIIGFSGELNSNNERGEDTVDNTKVEQLTASINELNTTIEAVKTTMVSLQTSVDKFNKYVEDGSIGGNKNNGSTGNGGGVIDADKPDLEI